MYRSSGTTDHGEAKRLEHTLRSTETRRITGHTLDNTLAEYLAAKGTARAAYATTSLAKGLGADTRIADISPAHIAKYKSGRKVSNGTIARELGVLRAATRYCRRELGWDIPDPTEGRFPPTPPHRLRWLTEDEADKLISAAGKSSRAPYLPDLITLALYSGMRKGELLGLTWNRVDLKNNLVHLSPEHQKGKRHSAVPLNTHAREALVRRAAFRAEHCPSSEWVFTGKRGLQVGAVKTSFSSACTRAKIADLHFHDLRHTCATWLVQAGVPIRTVAEILRHKNIATTMKYAHLAPDDARAGVRALERSGKRSGQRANVVKRSPFLA